MGGGGGKGWEEVEYKCKRYGELELHLSGEGKGLEKGSEGV